MPDDKTNSAGDAAPPKIKLNLMGGKPPAAEPTISIRPSAQKADTTRIELSQAQPPAATVGDTQPVQADPATVKRSTIRIEVPPAVKADTQKVKTETKRVESPSLHSTMRVEVAEPRKTETTRIDIPAEAFQKAPGAAPRSPAHEGAEDVFKRTTIPVGIPTPAPAPAARPKTISVKKPVPEAAPTATEKAVSEAKKSETARIDLPADSGDRPATRPKTIRIKRPDGTSARKPLTISRPDAESAPERAVPLGTLGEEEPAGSVFSVLALVALLLSCVLLYVLAAQTFAPDLPWPGRI